VPGRVGMGQGRAGRGGVLRGAAWGGESELFSACSAAQGSRGRGPCLHPWPSPMPRPSPQEEGGKAGVEGERALVPQRLRRTVDGALIGHGAVGVGRHLLQARLDEVEGQRARAREEAFMFWGWRWGQVGVGVGLEGSLTGSDRQLPKRAVDMLLSGIREAPGDREGGGAQRPPGLT
jgi:hypothetical protein